MNTFVLEIWDDEPLCTFYSVRWDDAHFSETDKFFIKYKDIPRFERPVNELAIFLASFIGQEKGAVEGLFRFENRAHGLPPPGKYQIGELEITYSNFPLRLYCLRLTDHLVILFGGAEKTSASAQDGKTSMTFYEANQFADRINEAIKEEMIIVNEGERKIYYFNGSDDIIL